MYAALVLGTHDYLAKNGFGEAVIGLSGGIDSSLVATIAVDALGAERVHGISMPSRYSSEGSLKDAETLCERLGIDLKVVPIEEAHVAFASMLAPVLGREPSGLTDENLQSRLRGVLLMATSNAKGWIVLTTGNKSEMATGYSTLYGDSAGGFAVIKDVPKTLVYDLCRYRNTQAVLEGVRRALILGQSVFSTSRPRPSCGPINATTSPSRPTRNSTRCCRATSRVTAPPPTWWPRASTRPSSTRWSASSTARSTSDARCLPACASRPRRSAPAQPITNHYRRSSALEESGVAERVAGDAVAWRGIDELAGLVGAYCWVEHRLFEVTGAWASVPEAGGASIDSADAELRVWCAATAQRHGALAGRWAERFSCSAGSTRRAGGGAGGAGRGAR